MPYGWLNFTFEVDGRWELDRIFRGYVFRLDNWGPFFDQIAVDFREYEAARFAAEGAFEREPRWQDLTEAYALRKARDGYGQQPILQRTGAMLAAVLDPQREETGAQMTLTIDSAYAIYHDSHRPRESHLPRRPILALSAARKTKWTQMLRDYIWDE